MIVRVGIPAGPAILDALRYAVAVVELGEEPCGILPLIEIGSVEAVNVVVRDKRTVVGEVMIENLGKGVPAQSAFKKQLPLAQDSIFGSFSFRVGKVNCRKEERRRP